MYGLGELPTRDELAAQIFTAMIANYSAGLTGDGKPAEKRLTAAHAKAYMIADWWLAQISPPAWTPAPPPPTP